MSARGCAECGGDEEIMDDSAKEKRLEPVAQCPQQVVRGQELASHGHRRPVQDGVSKSTPAGVDAARATEIRLDCMTGSAEQNAWETLGPSGLAASSTSR